MEKYGTFNQQLFSSSFLQLIFVAAIIFITSAVKNKIELMSNLNRGKRRCRKNN